jgi:tRNA (guanine-N7-)-methyltransferase
MSQDGQLLPSNRDAGPTRRLNPTAPPPGTLIHTPTSYFERLTLASLFPLAQPLEVELGSGDGSFLVDYARSKPATNFLGVERLLGRLRKIDRKGQRARLLNLKLIRVEASYFLEYMLPPQCAGALHVYFPDPWPKRKHRKNRLINARFTELACQVLQPGGTVYLRTDDADYFTQMKSVFAANPRFHEVETPAPLLSLPTDFERDFQARGVSTLRAAYQLAGAPMEALTGPARPA